jgi:hypothetical protein
MILWISILFISMFQFYISLIQIKPLKGAIEAVEKPVFNWYDWWSGAYQEKFNQYIENNIGLRNCLIKLHNQIEFSLFGTTLANGIIIGKENYLYEDGYIMEYIGANFDNSDTTANEIKDQCVKFQKLEKYLNSKGKQFMLVIAPGKPFYFPEYLPEEYEARKKDTTIYKLLKVFLKENNVTNIDYNQWFIDQKSKTDYPLYTKYGVHWSDYGAKLCFDSMSKFMQYKMNKKFINYSFSHSDITYLYRFEDADILESFNLIFPEPDLKKKYNYYYRNEPDTGWKPRVLCIADSYYWTMLNSELPKWAFADSSVFWYYQKEAYIQNASVSQLFPFENEKCFAQLDSFDYVIFLCGGSNYNRFGFGWINDITNKIK